jgi:hypothetical protein
MLNRSTLPQRLCLLHVSVSILIVSVPSLAQVAASETSLAVRQAVLGIMSYTRWPERPVSLRLCVVGQPDHAASLFDGPIRLGDATVVVSRPALQGGQLGAQCDAVYAGGTNAGEQQLLRLQLAGHPVLTITEDDPQCSGPSMFCLDTAAPDGQVGFAVNLDSVSRSGVLVNPRVLLLGRHRKSAP